MARIAEDLELLLLDNESAQPRLDRTRRGRALAGALLLDLAYDCRVRPALPEEPVPPGHLVALAGPVPRDPAVRPALTLLEQGPIAPAAAIAKLRKRAEDDVLDQLLRSGQIHQVQLTRQRRILRNSYAWPVKDRARVDALRARALGALFERQRPDPATEAVLAVLHRVGGLGAALNLGHDVPVPGWGPGGNTAEANLAATAAVVLPALG